MLPMATFPRLVRDELNSAHARSAAIPTSWPTRVTAAHTETWGVGKVTSSNQERDDQGWAGANLATHHLNSPGDLGLVVGAHNRPFVAYSVLQQG
jgi:hypothetical protein